MVAATATKLLTSGTVVQSDKVHSVVHNTGIRRLGLLLLVGAHVFKLAMSITTTRVAFDCALLLLSLLLWLVGVDKLAIAAKTFALGVVAT